MLLGLALTGCASVPRSSATAAPEYATTVEARTKPFGAPGMRDAVHQTVEVEVAGKVRTFLLDTGGGITIITPELAQEAGCAPSGRLSAHRMNNQRVDFPTCENLELKLGGESLRPAVLGIFDLNPMLPKDWPHLDGLLSLQTLEKRPVTFDFSGHRLILESDSSLKARIATAMPVTTRLSRPGAGAVLDLFFAASTKDGKKLWLMADSGSDAPLVLAPHAAQMLGANLDAPETEKKTNPAGETVAWQLKQIDLNVAGLGMLKPTATIRELIYDGNIGMPVLRLYVLTLDLRTGQAWASPAL